MKSVAFLLDFFTVRYTISHTVKHNSSNAPLQMKCEGAHLKPVVGHLKWGHI
jgi:hypothetical protein